jgi:hypothetical protein
MNRLMSSRLGAQSNRGVLVPGKAYSIIRIVNPNANLFENEARRIRDVSLFSDNVMRFLAFATWRAGILQCLTERVG